MIFFKKITQQLRIRPIVSIPKCLLNLTKLDRIRQISETMRKLRIGVHEDQYLAIKCKEHAI